MWNCMDDVLSRRTGSLYYYNLACSIPIYLHINLKTDNENCLVFWWYASTCRHLGIGGKHAELVVWEAQKAAMKIYMENKRFYTQGIFYGLDEMVHVHTLPDIRENVIDCFNLEDQPVQRNICFGRSDMGLPAGRLEAVGVPFADNGDEISLDVDIPAKGHVMA